MPGHRKRRGVSARRKELKSITIRLGQDDDDIREILEAQPDNRRGRFIREAIRAYKRPVQPVSVQPLAVEPIVVQPRKGGIGGAKEEF